MIADKGRNPQIRRRPGPSRSHFSGGLESPEHLLESGLHSLPAAILKRVLVVDYSQTGQLSEIAAQLIGPLREGGHVVHRETLVPVEPFPFPWPIVDFVDAMPECVQLDAPPLKPMSIAADAD